MFYSLLLEREGRRETEREKERERETSISCILYVPGPRIGTWDWVLYRSVAGEGGWGAVPMPVPWLGIEPATFRLQENTPTNRATPARAVPDNL